MSPSKLRRFEMRRAPLRQCKDLKPAQQAQSQPKATHHAGLWLWTPDQVLHQVPGQYGAQSWQCMQTPRVKPVMRERADP